MKYKYLLFLLIIVQLFSCSNDDSDTVEITVNTENMNFSIDENPYSGQLIGEILGSTNQGNVFFSIIEQNPTNSFTINAFSGEIFVDDIAIYDYETLTAITGKVKVYNGEVFSESLIEITINDVTEDAFVGSVDLKNQEEVNEFGLNSYREITGNLRIFNGDDLGTPITDLSILSSLEEIGGDLLIVANESLTNLDGLNNIKSAKVCSIFNNPIISNITALQNLETLESISVHSNPELINLDCFLNITSLVGSLQITSNNSLTSLHGLNNITTVNEGVYIAHNENLNNIFDLNSLEVINGSLEIDLNPNLINFNGLNNLNTVNGNLFFLRNENLFDIDALQNLTNFNGTVSISLCENLQSLQGLSGLTSVNKLQVFFCNSLQNLDGLENLTSFQGADSEINIYSNDILNDFCALQTVIDNGFSDAFTISFNLYNPTLIDLQNGNCSN